jgi:hypothetical protein
MSLSAMDKDVTTRLFRMLAVNEQTANSVKRDHASYAKLSLLTKQAELLQQQAVHVVNKVATKESSDEISLCTALSTEFDDGANRLLCMMNVNDKTVTAIKKDPPASAKLSLLGEQVALLQEQAREAVEDAKLNHYLSQLTAGTVAKLVCGTMYYLYTQNGKEVLSRIASHEWANYEEYHGKYLYDYDFTFRKQLEEHEKQQQREEKVFLLSHTVAAGKGASWGGLHVAATPATTADVRADGADEPVEMDLSVETVDPDETCASAAGTSTPICSVLSRW